MSLIAWLIVSFSTWTSLCLCGVTLPSSVENFPMIEKSDWYDISNDSISGSAIVGTAESGDVSNSSGNGEVVSEGLLLFGLVDK